MVSVVAISCHPDDVESGCFGTLALYTKKKADVRILLLTGGERGGQKEIRLKAAESACSIIGATLAYAGFEDGKLTDDTETVSWIEREIRTVTADIVFAPCPFDSHQDHRNGGNASISASRKTANVLLYETPTTTDFKPQIYVDIRETLEDKVKAMSMHKSLEKSNLYSEAIRCQAKYRADQMRLFGGALETFQVVKWKLTPS
jgi:LmbE family N-acetylglucosaminyl deacetylase